MKWQDILDVLRGFAQRAAGALACVAVCGRPHLVVEFTVGDEKYTGDVIKKVDD